MHLVGETVDAPDGAVGDLQTVGFGVAHAESVAMRIVPKGEKQWQELVWEKRQ